jgi:preprotein translocase subunit SecG
MLNTLLFIHLVIALLLVAVILLQKTSTDGLSGIGGGSGNMGLISGRSAASFLHKLTIILGVLFFVNAIMLANLSSKVNKGIANKIEQTAEETLKEEEPATSLPIAK